MNTKLYNRAVKTARKSPIEIAAIAFMAIMLLYWVIPNQAIALGDSRMTDAQERALQLEIASMQNAFAEHGVLPTSDVRPAAATMDIIVTAYNSVPWQTDSTPCIGAQGTDICAYLEAGSNTCAANFVPLGTVLHVDGMGLCVVRDRMNARYYYRVDWYMGGEPEDIEAARQFGASYKTVGIY